MTNTPLTTETTLTPSLDTTEIPVQFRETAPISARAVADTFPHTPWVQTHRRADRRLMGAVATFGGFIAAASAAALIIAGTLGGLS